MKLVPVWIYIENGTFLEAKSFGVLGTKIGEMNFNSAMTGYQEILTDPSYAGQFVVSTMPEVGIVGTNADDMESSNIHASGMIVRKINANSSNFRSQKNIINFLHEHGGFGICDIDTRYLTKMIRDNGSKMMVASTEISDKTALKAILDAAPNRENIDYTKQVTTSSVYVHKLARWDEASLSYRDAKNSLNKKVVVLDFGVKKSILSELCESGLEVEVAPASTSAKSLISRFKNGEISGVLLSCGPGNPLILKEAIEEIKLLIKEKLPMLGIGLGHQLISIAHGHSASKLKFGQHGDNYPVKNIKTGSVKISTQNYNYNVSESVCKIATSTHINLFSEAIAGLKYNDSPIISVQYHPEGGPGPHENRDIFQTFVSML
ncbi:MAG: glutamine-hydrolyzing carbamoyl-phosphate synthase small subunit [Campylobacteraceae bacterium]|nr:glutamine-hydrolyzing carbamoyl-phosphate synthase small subunit [Campylobacteraceae bacterium]